MELDLGDMLAALEKQQQAMKARQLTNTKPLSFTGIGKVNHMLKINYTHTMDVNICSKAFNSYEIPFISCDVLNTAWVLLL